jgi:hypothetical protein
MKNIEYFKFRNYVDLNTIYPVGEIQGEVYSISRISLTESEVYIEHIRGAVDGNSWLFMGLKPNFDYVRLVKKGDGVMMSDTPMERRTNLDFISKANGDVLIFGLGLGLIIIPLLQDEEIKSVTVVELHQELIDTVLPILNQFDKQNKLTVIQGDCFEYHTQIPKEKKYDCIYGDIWIDINTENYEEMKDLTKKYKNKLNRSNPNSFITHWMKSFLQSEIRKEKRNSYSYW